MFAPYCPTCRARVLMGYRRVEAVQFDGEAPHQVILRCHCGTRVRYTARG